MFRRIIRVPLRETPKELSEMVRGPFWFLLDDVTLILAIQAKIDNLICEANGDPYYMDTWIDNLSSGIEEMYGKDIRKRIRDNIMRDRKLGEKFISKEKRLALCEELEEDLKSKVFEHIVDLSYVIGRRIPKRVFSSLNSCDVTECYLTIAKIRRNCIELTIEEG